MQKADDMIYSKSVYIYCNLKVHISPFSLCFSILKIKFKTFILRVEVGITFKALNNESNTKCCVEIHLLLHLCYTNSNKNKRVKSSKNKNDGDQT